MSPMTRSSSSAANHLTRAGSASIVASTRAPKRQKIEERPGSVTHDMTRDEDAMSVDPVYIDSDSLSSAASGSLKKVSKNAHLKGRKRFMADFEEMKDECKKGLTIENARVKRFISGDDEGSIEVTIEDIASGKAYSLNLFISDTTEYPASHTVFAASSDGDAPARLERGMEELASVASLSIQDMIERLLTCMAKPSKPTAPLISHSQETDTEEEDDGSEEDYDMYEDYDDLASGPQSDSVKLQIPRLQREFTEIVATNYRPGFIPLGYDDFALTVSLPVIKLASSVPPQALMAWDRRLLLRSQYLTLLMSGFRGIYPLLNNDGFYEGDALTMGASLSFKVGLTQKYKPGRDQVKEAIRTFGLITKDAEDELLRIKAEKMQMQFDGDVSLNDDMPQLDLDSEPEVDDEGRFDRFSLSGALETLLNSELLKLIQYRRKFGLGWAGAELLYNEVEQSQVGPEELFRRFAERFTGADEEERVLGRSYNLPLDPLHGLPSASDINLPLIAFCYLVRRLTLVSRYCIVCHNKVNTNFEALKPYVCDSKLCAYQYYALHRGPSLEYEIIHNPETVDLLVSLTYTAAAENVLDEPLPLGIGLLVPEPNLPSVPSSATTMDLCDFDELPLIDMRKVICKLIDSLPSISDMRKHLLRKTNAGKSKPKLKDLDPGILPAAWLILRWCVASCTAHLEELTGEHCVRSLDPAWRQFRFSVGAPDAEAKFNAAVLQVQRGNANAVKYPSLFAFHGSPIRNWHSIIRHGLWYKHVANGRAFGDGVYLAKDGSVSMGYYAAGSAAVWRNSRIVPSSCVALAEIVNLPSSFVSSNPYFVVKDTHWIMCRYLLVKGTEQLESETTEESLNAAPANDDKPKGRKWGLKVKSGKSNQHATAPLVPLDPTHPITLNGKKLEIPAPSFQMEALLNARQAELVEEEPDQEDMKVFEYTPPAASQSLRQLQSQTTDVPSKGKGKALLRKSSTKTIVVDDWIPDPAYVRNAINHLMPPPLDASPHATLAVQREYKAMLKEQEAAKRKPGGLKELGWFLPQVSGDDEEEGGGIGDNLFQWIVEMHSFEDSLPITKDLKTKGVNSLIFEIRFPPAFPHSPPFFRIITPRFLPFIHGGGGHVTGGGSICMDLLTADGWLPSYSISAVLLQIKLAISNLDPRPARLAPDWQRPYEIGEALAGYKRAASAHGWQVPIGLEKLAR